MASVGGQKEQSDVSGDRLVQVPGAHGLPAAAVACLPNPSRILVDIKRVEFAREKAVAVYIAYVPTHNSRIKTLTHCITRLIV